MEREREGGGGGKNGHLSLDSRPKYKSAISATELRQDCLVILIPVFCAYREIKRLAFTFKLDRIGRTWIAKLRQACRNFAALHFLLPYDLSAGTYCHCTVQFREKRGMEIGLILIIRLDTAPPLSPPSRRTIADIRFRTPSNWNTVLR